MVLYPNQEKSKTKELKQLNINAMGRRIRVIRERKDLSREELAEKNRHNAGFHFRCGVWE